MKKKNSTKESANPSILQSGNQGSINRAITQSINHPIKLGISALWLKVHPHFWLRLLPGEGKSNAQLNPKGRRCHNLRLRHRPPIRPASANFVSRIARVRERVLRWPCFVVIRVLAFRHKAEFPYDFERV
jgi:hypothetical protein